MWTGLSLFLLRKSRTYLEYSLACDNAHDSQARRNDMACKIYASQA